MRQTGISKSILEALCTRLSSDRISRFAQGLGTLVPDATSASVIMLLIVAAAALAFGNPFAAITDAYYRGLWMLLPFTMQMTLILVLSTMVTGTPLFAGSWSGWRGGRAP